jgi:tetratricopeptide (TPR) repeat protein
MALLDAIQESIEPTSAQPSPPKRSAGAAAPHRASSALTNQAKEQKSDSSVSAAAAAAAPSAPAAQPSAAKKSAGANAAPSAGSDNITESDRLKEAGNEALKKENFDLAISLYSQALSVNANNLAALNNRAQAFLKLNKFANAEQDATEVLSREKSLPDYSVPNTKALYRRGLARKNIGGKSNLQGALDDFEALIRVEPANKTGKAERAKVLQMIAEMEYSTREGRLPASAPLAAASPSAAKSSTQSPAVIAGAAGAAGPAAESIGLTARTTTFRKRDSEPPASSVSAVLPPAPPSPADALSSPSKPASAAAAEEPQQRETANTPPRAEAARPAVSAGSSGKKAKEPAVPSEAPKSLYELERTWRGLKTRPDLFARYMLLFSRSTFKNVFKEAVTPDLLSSMLSCLQNEIAPSSPADAMRLLDAMKSMSKFDMTVSLLPQEDIDALRQIFGALKANVGQENADLTALSRAYRL